MALKKHEFTPESGNVDTYACSHLQPGIPKNSKSPQDYISYTVSAPSGRATAMFSADG